jgi:mannan endo-1,4-beta-mannosidase
MEMISDIKYVGVDGFRFKLGNEPFFLYSANYWQAMNLGSTGLYGNRKALIADLDKMKSKGINNLRIMASSEGPNNSPFRSTPTLMISPGSYDKDLLDGLDFAIHEIGKRGMKATIVLSNFWQWSGGFAQLVSWATNSSIPYPEG